jgi:hypothetical protein
LPMQATWTVRAGEEKKRHGDRIEHPFGYGVVGSWTIPTQWPPHRQTPVSEWCRPLSGTGTHLSGHRREGKWWSVRSDERMVVLDACRPLATLPSQRPTVVYCNGSSLVCTPCVRRRRSRELKVCTRDDTKPSGGHSDQAPQQHHAGR